MAVQKIVGRKNELETLDRVFNSNKSEFIILYGRRRVGKTFLINQRFGEHFTFRMTAIGNATLEQQLDNFHTTLTAIAPKLAKKGVPPNWFQAFQLIIKFAEESKQKRKVIFFDELPWFDAYGSDFLQALEHFWNSWASFRSDVLLIGCGSAASWMLNEIVHNKGGLHNRITERIALQPFTLAETEQFLRSRGAVYDRYQLLQLYMTMGGIPYYLDNIQVNRSIDQNIDRMFFTAGGLLSVEYDNLYRSLFNKYERHVAIIEALIQKSKGLIRKELLITAKLSDGGNISEVLDELEQSGFIKRYYPFGKAKRTIFFQLIDPFSLFYLTFVKDSKVQGQGAWLSQNNSPKWRAWSGYAYEQICRYHVDAIKKQLRISGVYAEISAWRSKESETGAQIDLIIDRNDRVINICEIKFSTDRYSITKPYAENLRNKLSAFRTETGTNKTLFLTMITTFGLKNNEYSMQLVNDTVEMEALFEF
jgi:uncharacterized protein